MVGLVGLSLIPAVLSAQRRLPRTDCPVFFLRELRAEIAHLPRHAREFVAYHVIAGRCAMPALSWREEEASAELLAEARHVASWFHGGEPGRLVGDFLQPSALTGRDPRDVRDLNENRSSAVFVTHHLVTAQRYAESVCRGDGVTYRVEPDGELRVDVVELRLFLVTGRRPVSFCCVRARVMEILG